MHNKKKNITLDLGFHDSYDHNTALGVIKFARTRRDWRLMGNEWLFQLTPSDGTPGTDGIIARLSDAEEVERVKRYGVPVVDIAGAFEDPDIVSVLNDDHLTGYLAGRHLASRDLRRVAFIGIRDRKWSANRLRGLQDVAQEGGIDELIVHEVDASWLRRSSELAPIARWLRGLPLPCGILAANDILGYKTTLAAAMAGLRVPEQVAVMGVDNESVFCELAQPGLTSIPCDCEKIGREAARLLGLMLDGEAVPRRTAIAPWPVVARDSTDIRIGDDELVRQVKRYIRANAEKGINVADVTAAFPLSRRGIEMRFRKSGATIHDEILAARLDIACRLLQEGKNASEAGLGSGFGSIQHFHYIFRKHLRMTPSAYAARFGKGEPGRTKGMSTPLPSAPV